MKLFKFIEYAYLLVAAFFVEESIRTWSEDSGRAYLYLFMAAIAVFMFFFKRKFRKRMEREQRNQE